MIKISSTRQLLNSGRVSGTMQDINRPLSLKARQESRLIQFLPDLVLSTLRLTVRYGKGDTTTHTRKSFSSSTLKRTSGCKTTQNNHSVKKSLKAYMITVT